MHENRTPDTRGASDGGRPFAAAAVMEEQRFGPAKRARRPGAHAVPFHAACEEIAPGWPRGGALLMRGWWEVFLRVRTNDERPDFRMVADAARELGIKIACRGKHTTEEDLPVVSLKGAGPGGQLFYEISMHGRDPKALRGAMRTVNAIGVEIAIAREIAQNLMSSDITEFMREMVGEQ